MRIIVENSTWNNVGDGWYQFSLYHLLKEIYPQHEVVMGEGPIERSFRLGRGGQLRDNALNWMLHQRGDIHVFSGPMIPYIDTTYRAIIEHIKSHDGQYMLLSASGTGLTKERTKKIGKFLRSYPPLLFSSRDEESYNSFSPYVDHSYNGICSAFLVDRNMTIQRYTLDTPFFISSFYTELEPYYTLRGDEMSIEGLHLTRASRVLGLPYRISRHLNFRRHQQAEVGGYKIVRTVQNLNTRFNHINFAMPNSFISFNPLSYLELAASAEFTISDRVHACAISLACNRPTRFLFETPRAGIFDRLGFDYRSNKGIIYPNMKVIDRERKLLIDEIKRYIK